MTSLFMLMILRDSGSDAAFARYKTAMKAMPSYEVQVQATDKRRLNLTADLVIDGRKRMAFDARAPYRYVLTLTPSEFREIDWSSKTYDVFPYLGMVQPVASRVSDLPKAIPFWLEFPDLKMALPGGTSPQYAGKQMVGGETCDLVRVAFNNRIGKGTIELDFGSSGLLYRYYSVVQGMGGQKEFEWVLKNYRPLRTIAASRFDPQIPDGFMPYGLPDHHLPPEVGKKPYLKGWVDSRSGKPWSAPHGQPLLFVLTTKESTPNLNALSALKRWRSELAAKKIEVAVASDSESVAGSKGLLYDPGRQSLSALDAPSTPMFFLLDSGGVLRNMWMGFSPAESQKMHGDLLKAVSELK